MWITANDHNGKEVTFNLNKIESYGYKPSTSNTVFFTGKISYAIPGDMREAIISARKTGAIHLHWFPMPKKEREILEHMISKGILTIPVQFFSWRTESRV